MANLWQFQSVLNRGELDPLTVGRIDLQQYYNGVSKALNVLAIPQGGLKKRPGQEYLATALQNGRLENFSFNVEQNYLLVFTPARMQIFKDGVLQTNINGSGNDYLVVPWSFSQISEFDYIQSADTIIITHTDVQTQRITRSSDTDWAITGIVFDNIPQYDFNDGLSPTPVDEVQRITFANDNNGDRFKLALNGILTEEIVLSTTGSGVTGTANSIQEELLALPNTGNTGISVSWISSLPEIYEITFSGDSADNWDEITGTPVYSQNLNFEITGSTIANGVSRSEDTWSNTRGWPATCTFHEGRLWLGGSASRPQTIWGSFVNDFFNFFSRKGLDDESVEATLDTDQVNAIESIFSNRSLQVFTSGGEFYVPESPITPENIAVSPQSNIGSKRVRPVTIDGVTLFLQRTGKALIQFVFLNDFQANQSRSVSVLAPHLIKDPVKMSVSRGTETSDANYVYLVNSDGTMTVFNTLAAEDVAGFTRWESGKIKSVAVVGNQVYILVERFIDGLTVYFIERENLELNTDAAKLTTGFQLTTITGLDHLEGETIKVKADGAVRADAIVSGGEIEIEPAADVIETGLEYFPEIKTLPLNVGLQNGPNASQKKKITRVSVQLYQSNGILVQGQRIADKTMGLNQFDPPEPQTGLRRIFVLGWSLEAFVTITQDTPMQMTILNIGLEVSI